MRYSVRDLLSNVGDTFTKEEVCVMRYFYVDIICSNGLFSAMATSTKQKPTPFLEAHISVVVNIIGHLSLKPSHVRHSLVLTALYSK